MIVITVDGFTGTARDFAESCDMTTGGLPEERRANIRLNRVLAIEIEHQGEFKTTVAVDLSVTGFQVASSFALPLEEDVAVRLHLTNGPRIRATARTMWCEPLELGMFRMGCQFEEMESQEDFESLYRYVERERLNAEGLEGSPTLELSTQVTLRSMTSRELDRFAVLARVAELLNGCYRLDELLERALKIVVEATGAERGMLLLDRGGQDLEMPAFHTMSSNRSQDYSRSVVGQVLESGQPLLSLDARKDERLFGSSSLKVMGTRSVLCLPVGNFGMIYLDSSVRAGAFTEVDLRLASVIGGLAAGAIERSEYFSQLVQQQKLAAMGTLMAGILHELNSPLGSILGIGELLDQQVGGELTRDLIDEAHRCRKLVRDLLRLSRKEPVEMCAVNLAEVSSAAVAALGPELERHRLELAVQVATGLPEVVGNPDHLRQVVLNLLSNAIFETARAGGRYVELRLSAGGSRLWLTVADTGGGIPQEHLERVFDPFFTTKGAEDGTGLGLSIVQRIVAEHGGTIFASNRSGGGALFTVELPVQAQDQATA